jgi:GMP synthase (glutamine-hydrolysing)
VDALIRARGHRVRFHNFERHPDAKPMMDRYRGLIVLGGPMNVEDRHHRMHLKTELTAIEHMLEQGKPVLGICLGAQLLAHVLGAPVRRHEQPEIGWYDLYTTGEGRLDGVLGALGASLPVFQWHRYTYDLPRSAVQLARTVTCEQQAFRWSTTAYGFQFHLEADAALVERWLTLPSFRAELTAAGRGGGDAEIRAATQALIAATRQSAEMVFNNFLDLIGRRSRQIALPSRGALP